MSTPRQEDIARSQTIHHQARRKSYAPAPLLGPAPRQLAHRLNLHCVFTTR
jgi:hypothetical protein